MGNKNISRFVSVVVVLLLVVASPGNAFSLSLGLDNDSPTKGQTITFTGKVDVGEREFLPVDFLVLSLEGAENYDCRFDVNGNLLSECKGISIERISSPDFGYGYGYGFYGYGYDFGYGYGIGAGELEFRISLDTSQYSAGSYNSALKVHVDDKEFSKGGESFVIKSVAQESSGGGSRCRTEWSCSEWSACDGGLQTRSCEKERASCVAIGAKPAESRVCIVENGGAGNELNLAGSQIFEGADVSEEGSGSVITGAVTGAQGGLNLQKTFLISVVFFAIIVGLFTILAVRKFGVKRPEYDLSEFY